MKPIYIKHSENRWYLVWTDTNQIIASFVSEFQAYSARRAILTQSTINHK
jgi:hypothetical protein